MSLHVPSEAVLPISRGAPDRYRIAFAIHRYFDYGGLERVFRRVVLACADLGHNVQVLTSAWDGPRPENLHVRILPLAERTNHGRSREFADVVRSIARQERFDCLVGFNKMPGLDVYRCGDPCLADHLRETKLPFVRWLPRYRTYLKLEEGIFGNSSDAALLVLTESEKERIVRYYGAAESRIYVLPAGIDRRRLHVTSDGANVRASIRQPMGILDTDLFLLMVGSSFERKGVDRAILAMSSLPEYERRRARLVIVGNGHASSMKRLAKRLKLADQVVFAGAREDVANFYRSADILLHPALQETGGATILEAMVSGLPVLVTENCGYASHVKRADAGLVCPHPFAQPVLNKLLGEMLSADARRKWRQNAIAYCDRTDIYSMIETTIDMILTRAEKNRRAA